MDIAWNMLRIERVFCLLFVFLRATFFFLVGFSWCFSQRSVKLHRGFEDGKDYRLEAAFTSRQGSNGHLIFCCFFCDFEKSAKMGLIYTYIYIYFLHIYLYIYICIHNIYIYTIYLFIFFKYIYIYFGGLHVSFFVCSCWYIESYWKGLDRHIDDIYCVL